MPLGGSHKSKVDEILSNFTKDELAVLATKKLKGSYRLPALMKKLRNLGVYDLYADELHGKYDKVAIFGCIGTFVSLFILFVIFVQEFITGASFLATLIIPFLFGYLATHFWKKNQTLEKNDLRNEFRFFLIPLFATLGEDIMPNSKIFVEADIADPMHDAYQVKYTEPTGPDRRSVHEYHQNWITSSMLFSDQTRFSFVIERQGTKIWTTKRRSSGKVKTKGKYKMRHSIHLRMMVPKAHYVLSRKMVNSKGASLNIHVDEQEQTILIKAKYKQKGGESDSITIPEFLRLMRVMYSSIQPK